MSAVSVERARFGSLASMVFMAVCLTGCVGPGVSPRSSTSPAMEGSFSATVSVPAGGSVDVRLVFEGSSSAAINVYAQDSNIGATFGAATLSPQASPSGGSTLTAELSKPVDGPLHVTNSGSQAETVGVLVTIETARTLTITPSVTAVANGQAVTIDIVLTQPVAGDAVQAELVDPAGTHTSITLTPAGSGHWTGTVTPTVGGDNQINAWTLANGIRRADVTLNVSSGTVSLSSGFTERLSDTNGDGLADALILTPTITVAKAGSYRVRATLADSTGKPFAQNSNPTAEPQGYALRSGSQALDIVFQGSAIYKSGLSGPYRLVDVRIFYETGSTDEIIEANIPYMGTTQAYSFLAFAH